MQSNRFDKDVVKTITTLNWNILCFFHWVEVYFDQFDSDKFIYWGNWN